MTLLLLAFSCYDDEHRGSLWLCGLPKAIQPPLTLFLTPSSVFWLRHSITCFYSLVDSICKCRCPVLKIVPLWCSIIAHIICSKKNSTVIYTDPRESSVPYSMNSDCHRILSTHLLKYQFHSFLPTVITTPRNVFERQSSWIQSQIAAVVAWSQNNWLIQWKETSTI